jgi:hypothetical protein
VARGAALPARTVIAAATTGAKRAADMNRRIAFIDGTCARASRRAGFSGIRPTAVRDAIHPRI